MGLMKTFLSTTSAHGFGKTTHENPIRRWFWVLICACCYLATISCIFKVIKKALNPENVLTRSESRVVQQGDGKL